jgi:hypothetical protein
LDSTAAQIPLKSSRTNISAGNTSKINGEKSPYLRGVDDRRTAQIPDFEPEENQTLVDKALFARRKVEYTEEEDDIDFMLGDPKYARPVQKRPDAER